MESSITNLSFPTRLPKRGSPIKDITHNEIAECWYEFESRFLDRNEIAFNYSGKLQRYFTPLHVSIVNLMDAFNFKWTWFNQTPKNTIVDVFENYDGDQMLVDYQIGILPYEDGTKIHVYLPGQIDRVNRHGMTKMSEDFAQFFKDIITKHPKNKFQNVLDELYHTVTNPVWQSYIK